MRTLAFRLTVAILLAAVGAWAQSILHIGPGANTGLTCPDGITDAAVGCGIDPNPVPTDHLDVFVVSGGVDSIGLLYLIIGIPLEAGDVSPSVLPGIDRIDAYNPYVPSQDPSPSTYNPSPAIPATGCGTLASGDEAYSECGFDGNNSNNFVNWSGAVSGLGINPVQFALYYYDLSAAEDLGGKGLYDIFLDSTLPLGTMEIAYGCATGDCPESCYSTPFTEAGMVGGVVVPEPASVLLVLGAALALLGLRSRIRKQ